VFGFSVLVNIILSLFFFFFFFNLYNLSEEWAIFVNGVGITPLGRFSRSNQQLCCHLRHQVLLLLLLLFLTSNTPPLPFQVSWLEMVRSLMKIKSNARSISLKLMRRVLSGFINVKWV